MSQNARASAATIPSARCSRGQAGDILREQGNGYSAEGGDRTAHAEKLLATWAAKSLDLATSGQMHALFLRRALRDVRGSDLLGRHWAPVYGQSEKDLKAATGAHAENPTLDLPCRIVFAAGQRPTEVVGPMLEEEAAQLHVDYWNSKGGH